MERSSLKRKLEEEEEAQSHVSKRQRSTAGKGLLDLSDDVLLHILQRLSHPDLLNLNETCVRLQRVSSDDTLWRNVSTKTFPLPPHKFRKILKFLGPKTQSIVIGGRLSPKMEVLTPAILESISAKCPALTELSLESCAIDAEQ